MAYNTSKGGRQLGDIKNEDDPDTQIDFGTDQIALATGGAARLTVTNVSVTSAVALTASAFSGDGSALQGISGSGGDTSGPGSATDHAIARYSGTGGKTIQNSTVIVDDSGNASGVASLNVSGTSQQELFRVDGDAGQGLLFVSGSGNVGIGTKTPAYDLHVNGAGVTVATVDGGPGADAYLKLATNGVEKSYLKLGSGGNFIVAQDATGGDLLMKAKPGGVSTTYLTLDGTRGTLTASVNMSGQALSCSNQVEAGTVRTQDTVIDPIHISSSLNISGSKFYGDGSALSNLPPVVPGGVNYSVQFNSGSSLTGSLGLQYKYNNPLVQLHVLGGVSASVDILAGQDLIIGRDATIVGRSTLVSSATASKGLSINADGQSLYIGASEDFSILHTGGNTLVTEGDGHLTFDISTSSKNARFMLGDDIGAGALQVRNNSNNTVHSTDSRGVTAGTAYGIVGVASGSVSINDVIVAVGYNSTFVKFSKASPNTLTHGRGPFYVAYEAGGDGAAIRALKSRLVTGLNTSTATSVGDAVYLNPASSGSYVYTVPNPTADAAHFSLLVRVGRVVNVHASTGAIMLEPPGGAEPLVGQVLAGGGTSTLVAGFGNAFSGSQGSCAVLATANTDPSPGDDDQIKSAYIRSDGSLQITLDDSSGVPLLTYTIFA
tara:strand:- start:7429 stop:9414 length:1986 start_codon:yes stop_codon:yes gene_type:complete